MSESNGKYPPAYIEDGYTRTVFIAGIERLHPSVTMTFRPMLAKQWARMMGRLTSQDEGKGDEIASQMIASRVSEWDIKKSNGQLVDHTDVSQVARIQTRLKTRIFNIVIGQDGGDEDPGLTELERRLGSDDRLAEVLTGSAIESEAADEKN